MRTKRLLAFLLAFALTAAMIPYALAADVMKKGKVAGNTYTNPDGVSFTVPETFTVSAQQNKKAGFFRILLSGPVDAKRFGPAIVIDITPGSRDMEEYTGKKFLADLEDYPLLPDYDEYKNCTVIGDRLFEEYGTQIRENLVAFRLQRLTEARVAFSYSYCWNTERYFVRASYLCFGAQRTLTDDIPRFRELYNSLIIP
jgi:hypothetical protein